MKFTEKEITEKIKQLKPLEIVEFGIQSRVLVPITLNRSVSNNEIIKELRNIYDKYNNPSTPKLESESKETETRNVSIPTRDNFYKTKISNLDYRSSSTFFSPQFGKKTHEILVDQNYNNLTKEEVGKINELLQDLSTFEFEWKEYNRRIITKETTHNIFKEEFLSFDNQFTSFCFPSSEDLIGQRANRKFMCYKVGLFAKSLIDHLYDDKQYRSLVSFTSYSSEKLGKLVTDSLDAKRIFNNLARVSIKRAHEKLLHYDKKQTYKDDVLSINKIELVEDFRLAFAVETFYAIINYGEKNTIIDQDVSDIICRDVQVEIYYKSLLTNILAKDRESYLQYLDLTQTVVNMFVSSGFFTSIVKNTTDNNNGRPTTTVQLVLPNKLTVEVLRPFKLPNIVRPETLTKNGVDSLIKPLINGKCDLTKSDHLVMALNISRSKPHKVNELFLNLCDKFFDESAWMIHRSNSLSVWLMEGNISLKTVHSVTTHRKAEELRQLKTINNSTNISLKIANAVSTQLSKQYDVAIKFSNILEPCGITKVERYGYLVTKELDSTIASEVIELKYLRSRLFLAYYLKTFPIYITDTLCIRLRKYPREHWLSRTAGEFKHLLENFQPRRLTLIGFQNLLTAYYQASPQKLYEYNEFIRKSPLSKRSGMQSLSKYFQANPLDFTCIKKPMYFLNLHLALLQATNENYYTAVNVEVDQNASALVILSLVLRSKKMAESSNVIGGYEKSSPYDFIRSKAQEFFETIGLEIMLNKKDKKKKKNNKDKDLDTQQKAYIEENQDVINFICTSRNLHKYAIMCFCYNQTSMGRMEDFADEWLNEFGYLPNGRQRKVLNQFAACYPDFVEFVYPKTQQKLDILKKIVDVVCEEAPKISIRTLDGEVINWAFYATSPQSRKYYDVIDHKHKAYYANILKERKTETLDTMSNSKTNERSVSDFPDNLQLDSLGLKRKFLSYLIHSIDASILRRIINKMKKEHKSSINHLHDCVILHPNDLNSLYIVIKEIYSSPDIYNLIELGVFDQIESILSPEGKEKLKVLKTEFFSLTDDFVSELGNINPHHMYSLQD